MVSLSSYPCVICHPVLRPGQLASTCLWSHQWSRCCCCLSSSSQGLENLLPGSPSYMERYRDHLSWNRLADKPPIFPPFSILLSCLSPTLVWSGSRGLREYVFWQHEELGIGHLSSLVLWVWIKVARLRPRAQAFHWLMVSLQGTKISQTDAHEFQDKAHFPFGSCAVDVFWTWIQDFKGYFY